LAFSAVAIGTCTSVLYIVNIKEKPLCEEAIKYEEKYRGEKIDVNKAEKKGKMPSDWIKEF
jgi:hypothetical protein